MLHSEIKNLCKKVCTDVSQKPKLGKGNSTFLQAPKDNMRFGELSTGLRFAGAGGRATGKVVGGRGPEDTIKRGTDKSNLYFVLSEVFDRILTPSRIKEAQRIYYTLAISNL